MLLFILYLPEPVRMANIGSVGSQKIKRANQEIDPALVVKKLLHLKTDKAKHGTGSRQNKADFYLHFLFALRETASSVLKQFPTRPLYGIVFQSVL